MKKGMTMENQVGATIDGETCIRCGGRAEYVVLRKSCISLLWRVVRSCHEFMCFDCIRKSNAFEFLPVQIWKRNQEMES